MNAGLFLAVIVLASSASAAFINDWRPKFYEGLEAIAEVKTVPKGYDGAKPCFSMRHISGALKFGAETDLKTGIPGRVKWTVRARAACDGGAEIAPAMEFFRADGTSLGEKTVRGTKAAPWASLSWTFYAPANAASAHQGRCPRAASRAAGGSARRQTVPRPGFSSLRAPLREGVAAKRAAM